MANTPKHEPFDTLAVIKFKSFECVNYYRFGPFVHTNLYELELNKFEILETKKMRIS